MFPLRLLKNCTKQLAPSIRAISSQGPLVDVSVDNEGIATMMLQRAPVNSLNLDMVKEINKSLDDIANNKSRAMILTSASPTVFSAGLDIMELYKPDFKRAAEFWSTIQDVLLKLFSSSFITAAAINGHAPAGGCLLAISCEYRVMVTGKFTIGINDTPLGIIVPSWIIDAMCHTIPVRHAELALTIGKLFTPEEAIKVGLIDDAASDKSDAVAKCKEFIKNFDKIPSLARSVTKQRIRSAPLMRLQENRQADVDEFIQHLKNPMVQKGLGMYMQALKKKKLNK